VLQANNKVTNSGDFFISLTNSLPVFLLSVSVMGFRFRRGLESGAAWAHERVISETSTYSEVS
jgi:hypothetical protein